jgi:PKD repeat protein
MGIPDIGAFEYEASASPQLRVVIEANPTSGQAPLNVNFTGSATGGTAPYTYSWNFGDDQASTSQNPFHSYPSEGAYTATLTVTDNEGGNAVASQVITVTKTAVSLAAAMSATPTSGQAPLNVNFSDSVSGGTAP